MNTLQRISDSSLSEVLNLYGVLNYQIERYSHIKEILPDNLLKALTEAQQKAMDELDRRKDGY